MKELEILKRKIQRERKAREYAENLLEVKSLELYNASVKLKEANQQLEKEIQYKENTLQETERKYQELVETAQDIIYTISLDGYFQFINPAVKSILGYEIEELQKIHFLELVSDEFKSTVEQHYVDQLEKNLESSYLEFPVFTKFGEIRWLGQKVRIVEEAGEPKMLTAIARDITTIVESTEKLKQLSTRLSTILENLNEAILVEDEKRSIVLVNQRFCEIFQIPLAPQQLIGTDCSESAEQAKHLFKNPEKFVAGVTKLLSSREPSNNELLEMTSGLILERDYIPIFSNKKYMGHLWRYQDVTNKINSDRTIRLSEEKYRNVIENMRLGLMEVDNEGLIVKAYDRFCEITGYAEAELIGKKANELFLEEADQKAMSTQDNLRRKGLPDVYEIQVKKKDGEKVWLLISGSPNYNMEGEVIGSIGIHYDISDQKELQKQLDNSRKIAEKARDAEKEFLANMSHEIRNPILAIDGMANLLYDTPLNNEQKEYLDNLRIASKILLALVSGILDINKITDGKMEVNPEVFKLRDVLEAVEKMTNYRILEKKVEFKLFIDQSIPYTVIGDVTFLHQILLNLTGNSSKFTHSGYISLSANKVKIDGSIVWVEFIVKDTGIGIEQEKIETIFERFSQAGKATKNKYGGSGLGLPITKNLIELMGGSIKVNSELNSGTTFRVILPFDIAQNVAVQELETDINSETRNLSSLHILIVEDNRVNRLYLEKLLDKFGHTYKSAENGKEALDILQKDLFDLILMDIRMPIMDGYETTMNIRSQHDNKNTLIPIIALTASALLDEKEKALNAGMNYHLTKPFTPETLKNAINQFYSLSSNTELEQSSVKSSSFIDDSTIEELYQGDIDHLKMMVDLFLDSAPLFLEELEQEANDGHWENVRSIAHKNHPSMLMVGLKTHSHWLMRLEEKLSDKTISLNIDSKEIREFCNEVKSILPDLKESLINKN